MDTGQKEGTGKLEKWSRRKRIMRIWERIVERKFYALYFCIYRLPFVTKHYRPSRLKIAASNFSAPDESIDRSDSDSVHFRQPLILIRLYHANIGSETSFPSFAFIYRRSLCQYRTDPTTTYRNFFKALDCYLLWTTPTFISRKGTLQDLD